MSLIDNLGKRLFRRQSKPVHSDTRKKTLKRINLKDLDYETSKILLNDTQVIIGYDLIKYLLSSKKWTVTGDDTQKNEFITTVLNNLNTDINTVVKNLCTAILYGFSVQELIFDVNNNGEIVITDILPIHIKTLQNEPFIYKNGEIIAIHQEYDGEEIDIPINKCLKYTYNDKFGTGYGYGVLNDFKPIVEDKMNITQWEMNFLESFGAPTLYGKTDEHNREYLEDALVDVNEGLTNIVIGETDEVGILETGKAGDIFSPSKQYKDNQIFRRYYLGNLLLGDNSQTGTYAQSQTQLEFGQLVFDGLLEEIALTIQKQLIEPLIEINYTDITNTPKISFDKFCTGDYTTLLNTIKPLIDNGIIDSENTTVHEIIKQYIDMETGLTYENTLNELESEDYQPDNSNLNTQILSDLNAINQKTTKDN